MKSNISKTVNSGLCMGCGVCVDMCPAECIIMEHRGVNIPLIDKSKCIECGRCLNICAGRRISILERAEKLFTGKDIKDNNYLGKYLRCFKGYSSEYEVRYHCAAGGCLSQFLIWLIEKGYIDGAALTKFRTDSPMTPSTFIARTRDEVLAGKSSKYCVVSIEGVLSEIKQKPGKYVVVGLPCHIHAVRKCMDIDKQLNERIVGCFSIFCSSNKTMDSQKYLLKRYGVDKQQLRSFSYRDNGCLGSMYFRDEKGDDLVKPIYYLDYYLGMRAFFSVPRCSQCNDFFGELADVSFGDYNKGGADDDPIGINSLITRSNYWHSLLIECKEDGALCLEEIDEDSMVEAQKYCKVSKKGTLFYAHRNLRLQFKKAVPDYDNLLPIKPGIGAYLKVFLTFIMQFIGRHPSLWFIIKMMDKNKNN